MTRALGERATMSGPQRGHEQELAGRCTYAFCPSEFWVAIGKRTHIFYLSRTAPVVVVMWWISYLPDTFDFVTTIDGHSDGIEVPMDYL